MTQFRYYNKTGCDGMCMCCEKMAMIRWRNVWSMNLRVPDQEVDQRGLKERLCKKDCQAHKLNREDAMDHSRWWMLMVDADKGWLMISFGVSGWMFLLAPAHPGSPGQRAIKWLLLYLSCRPKLCFECVRFIETFWPRITDSLCFIF